MQQSVLAHALSMPQELTGLWFTAHLNATAHDDVDEDDDDDVVGPALPGMKGFRTADERVEAEMARRAIELKQAEWDRARGVPSSDAGADKSKSAPLVRQEWMTVMPESSFFKDSLAPANRPPGKAASFRTCVCVYALLLCGCALADDVLTKLLGVCVWLMVGLVV